jgi:hypothetical protein
MKRSTMLLGSLVLGSLAMLAACSGSASDPVFHGGPVPTTTSSTEPPPGEDAAPPATDSGSHDDAAVPDAGHDAAKPKDAFGGAPAYASKTGPSTRKGGHSFAGNTPKTNPAGKACLNCHGASGGAPTFAAAGTVYAGATPAASIEVRAIGTDGMAYSAYTDADGNFFFPAAVAPIAFASMAGARNATDTRLMGAVAPSGNCNDCHSTAGGAGHIVVTP